jgi:hypothetical protein
MHRTIVQALVSSVFFIALAGCGSETENPPDAGSEAGPDAGEPLDAAFCEFSPANWDTARASYPSSPYGSSEGSTIRDISLAGYPADWEPRSHDWTTSVRLSDYFDPDGNRGPGGTALRLLWATVSATWCVACRLGADVAQEDCHDLLSQGVVCYEALWANGGEGSNTPAMKDDVDDWRRDYFPDCHTSISTLDSPRPAKWYDLFDPLSLPLNVVIDLRTMKIMSVWSGYSTRDKDNVEGILADLDSP